VARFDGVLLDIDGVLATSWEPLPGAIETLAWLRERAIPFRLTTNTTTHTRADLALTLVDAGFGVSADEIVTAVVATASHLREAHPGAGVFVLSEGDAGADLEGVRIVDLDDGPDVIVVGGAYEGFDYETVNRVFRTLMDGAALVAMHRNLYWRTREGWRLDGGAYVAGLEEATGRRATVCGKPSEPYFAAALREIDVAADRAAMVGDDIEADVIGAQRAGLAGMLVRTGKFRPEDLERASEQPDIVLDSIADLPELLGSA
jgi:HAD superfamily hydrolase (TIGR01458 family)